MSPTPRHHGRHSPPPLVLGVLVVELVGTAVLLIIGVPWLSLLAYGGPLIAFTLALLSPTVQELGRRQPKLSVKPKEGDGHSLSPPRPRPWPIDADRILKNELEEARNSMQAWSPALESLAHLTTPFAIRPSEAAHEEAKDQFEEEVDGFEDALSDWLASYEVATQENANTFDVTILARNRASGAHAEAVTVILDLPQAVSVVDERPTVSPPPTRPTYQPPQPTSPMAAFVRPPAMITSRPWNLDRVIPVTHQDQTWKVSADGRQLAASVGDVHPNRSVQVGEPLLLRASGPGHHIVSWTAYSKSARREAKGTIALEIPSDAPRPGFGRLQGVTTYPDVALVDNEGEVYRQERSQDPPPRPATEDNDPFESIRQARALLEWKALGLDPTEDGPETVTVRQAGQTGTPD